MNSIFCRNLCGLALSVLMIGGLTLPASSQEDLSARFMPESFTLKNGMQVVVVSDHRVPVVTHMVWFKVGAADEAMGKSGLAHFLEHLMSTGTKKLKPREFSQIVARNGGQRNAFTSYDYTAYFQRVAIDRLPLMMDMQSDLMENLILTDEKVDSERDVVLEELSLRVDNNPGAILSNQMSAMLYQNHHYGTPLGGWRHELSNLTRADAEDWYDKYYAPNNAILIVAGDITAEELKPLAEKYYGRLKPRQVPERFRHVEPEHVSARRVELRDVRVKQSSLSRLYLVPSATTAEPGESEALELLSYIFGGSNNSVLYKELVINKGLAASAGSYYWATALNDRQMGVSATPRPGVDLETLETAVDEAIAKFKSEGVSEETVRKAIRTMQGDAIYALDSQEGLAGTFGRALTSGRTIEQVVSWPERIGKVTAEDVNRVARKYFDPKRSVTGHLLPEGDAS